MSTITRRLLKSVACLTVTLLGATFLLHSPHASKPLRPSASPSELTVQQQALATQSVTSASSPTVAPTLRVVPSGPLPADPIPASLDRHNADQVALAAAQAFTASDTLRDATPHDTALRATNFASASFATQIRDAQPTALGADWEQWAAHRAYLRVVPTLSGDDHPTDTAITAYRIVVLTITPTGRDGWVGVTAQNTAVVELTATGAGWKIQSLDD